MKILPWMHWVGRFFVSLSLAFLGIGLWRQRIWLMGCQPSSIDIFLLLLAIVSYASSQFLLSYAWFRLLALWSNTVPSKTDCHRIYGGTQIAKYLPGNFFHYVGRHLEGQKLGTGHPQLFVASLLETIGVIFAAAFLSFVGFTLFYKNKLIINPVDILSLSALSLIGIFVVLKLLPLVARRYALQLPNKKLDEVTPALLIALICYIIFFLHAGLITLAATLRFDANLSLEHAGGVLTAFSVSWIVGFITPGSPGGIGIREAAFVTSLSSFIEERHALIIAIVMRLITSGGDVVFFLITKMHGNMQTRRMR
ncbi:MAG: UPF0104 family protein [Candidatus Electrothrix sp. AW2]|nr:UPF0104 family protein [Candidatus Electrothrix gigas]MCI5178977.1 UPF0104 family protein [Candidatus Electrothrix gigas]